MKIVKAKQEYICDLTHEKIEIGEKYKRVNIRGVGIFHFKVSCYDWQIDEYLYGIDNEESESLSYYGNH